MKLDEIAIYPIARAQDVYVVRQAVRIAAELVGCDESHQVRFATALSELGREMLAAGSQGRAIFALTDLGALVVDLEGFPRAPSGMFASFAAAQKLVDDIVIRENGADANPTVRLTTTRNARSLRVTDVAAALARITPYRPLDELRVENRDLIATLESLTKKQAELVAVNEELEETNRGVLAMYAQAAREIEETNRGVVALYAELDDKNVRLNAEGEARSRFHASVSHELRSPLNSISALARLLIEPGAATLTVDQRKQVDLIVSSSAELLALVNDLLDLTKVESGRLDPLVETVDLPELFAELRGSLRPLEHAQTKLQVELPVGLTLETDRALLGRILRNLLTNALKFTRRGTVRLTARRVSDYELEITVSDTGIGIDRADFERVFEEFYQVRGPLQVDQQGTGLGLPYARRLSETLGGTLRLESSLGEGSVFSVRLPIAWQRDVQALTSPGTTHSRETELDTVLILDDDAGFRIALRGFLQGTVKQVLEADTGDEALRLMRATRPDLLFVDVRMPGRGEDEAIAQIRSDPDLSSIPVVLLTSSELVDAAKTPLGATAALLAKSNLNEVSIRHVIAMATA